MERSREGRDEEQMMREINVATVRKVKEEGRGYSYRQTKRGEGEE